MPRYFCELTTHERAVVLLDVSCPKPLSKDEVIRVLAVVQEAQFSIAAAAGLTPETTRLGGFHSTRPN